MHSNVISNMVTDTTKQLQCLYIKQSPRVCTFMGHGGTDII